MTFKKTTALLLCTKKRAIRVEKELPVLCESFYISMVLWTVDQGWNSIIIKHNKQSFSKLRNFILQYSKQESIPWTSSFLAPSSSWKLF